jgi:alkylation response protein AidB-like acyl-CoA dehydrogenase
VSDQQNFIRGGSFLLTETAMKSVFTPEDLTEEQKMIAKVTADFVEGEIAPHDGEIEKQDLALTVRLLKEAGELGLLGADVPEDYGGLGLDKVSSLMITENLVKGSSFALSHGAHVGIGSLPIVLFGTEEQKRKYLPDLASGVKLAAYCLTEPSSGSDALGAKTTAVLSEDGTYYRLNGTKQFITNAGFADIFIVYAKVDGKHFTAFIVEREFKGLMTGAEEKKMGIKGSSTRPLILEECRVPVENVLGEIGKGHVIAFNILNIGRYKLAAGTVGSSKWALELSIDYAKERKQFGSPLSAFPLIQKKLADMAIRTYVAESMVYRTTGLMEEAMSSVHRDAPDYGHQIAKAIAEYALECSINKVYGSECLDFVADEGLQIHGGYGYTQEYPIERIYRDSRINRIFEGTNEINRLLIPGTLMKKAMSGELPLLALTQGLKKELISYLPPKLDDTDGLAKEQAMVDAAKKIFLTVGGLTMMKYQKSIESEQEILESLANVIIEIFAMESALLRAQKVLARDGSENAQNIVEMVKVYVSESFARIENSAKYILNAVESGEMLELQLSILKKLTRFKGINTIPLKRSIAKRIIEAEKYLA